MPSIALSNASGFRPAAARWAAISRSVMSSATDRPSPTVPAAFPSHAPARSGERPPCAPARSGERPPCAPSVLSAMSMTSATAPRFRVQRSSSPFRRPASPRTASGMPSPASISRTRSIRTPQAGASNAMPPAASAWPDRLRLAGAQLVAHGARDLAVQHVPGLLQPLAGLRHRGQVRRVGALAVQSACRVPRSRAPPPTAIRPAPPAPRPIRDSASPDRRPGGASPGSPGRGPRIPTGAPATCPRSSRPRPKSWDRGRVPRPAGRARRSAGRGTAEPSARAPPG